MNPDRPVLTAVWMPLLLAACASAPSPVEEIRVLRSVREARVETTAWCTRERAGFGRPSAGLLWEDRFSMWSVRTDAAGGRVSDAAAARAGELRTCLATTSDPRVLDFYAEGTVDGVAVGGRGDCRILAVDRPEKGYTPVACQIQLAAPGYAGGLLTSNTLSTPVLFGPETQPAGYTQVSIATIRLWRRGKD